MKVYDLLKDFDTRCGVEMVEIYRYSTSAQNFGELMQVGSFNITDLLNKSEYTALRVKQVRHWVVYIRWYNSFDAESIIQILI